MKTGSRWQIAAFIVAVVASFPMSEHAHAQACRPDLNGDERVDGIDLGILLGSWGICPPGIESVSPNHGGTQGGTVISITGTGMSSVTAVRIGGVPCTNVTVLSPTLVRATTPPGAVGQAPISITSPGGSTLAPVPFTYVLQQVTSIVPNTGSFAGGTPITINGQHLSGATAVTVGGVPCRNVVSVSSTQVTAVTPAGSVGAVDVVVTCAKGAVTSPGGFTYLSTAVPSWATLIEATPDPAVVTDPELRAAIAATGWAWRVRDTATQIEMLLVPPGIFRMGCAQPPAGLGCDARALPAHQVSISQPFYLGRFEVTQAQWRGTMGANPAYHQGPAFPDADSRPVEQVSWNMVAGSGKSFMNLTGLRLPTEAEWERACRAGTEAPFYNGSSDPQTLGGIAWFGGNSNGLNRPVGQLAPNALGLHDMLGNAWEWVSDWYGPYSAGQQSDPTGPVTGSDHVVRGGSFVYGAEIVNCSYRFPNLPDQNNREVGFRVARNP